MHHPSDISRKSSYLCFDFWFSFVVLRCQSFRSTPAWQDWQTLSAIMASSGKISFWIYDYGGSIWIHVQSLDHKKMVDIFISLYLSATAQFFLYGIYTLKNQRLSHMGIYSILHPACIVFPTKLLKNDTKLQIHLTPISPLLDHPLQIILFT